MSAQGVHLAGFRALSSTQGSWRISRTSAHAFKEPVPTTWGFEVLGCLHTLNVSLHNIIILLYV